MDVKKYFENLKREEQNEKLRMSAIRHLNLTGESLIPQQTDLRTTTEIVGDLISRGGLHDEVATKYLGKVMSIDDAYRVVNKLSDDDLQFIIEQFNFIEKDIRSRYTGGKIPSALLFIDYYQAFVENFEKTKGVSSSALSKDDIREVIGPRPQSDQADGSYVSMPLLNSKRQNVKMFTGDQIINDNTITRTELYSFWAAMRKELKRQANYEKGLTTQQINNRLSIYEFTDTKLSEANGGPGGSSLDNIRNWVKQYRESYDLIEEIIINQIQGSGIRRRKKRKHINGKGLEFNKDDYYSDFGCYLIDSYKLDNNILHLKTKKKNKVHNLPPKKIDNKTKSIIKKVMMGGKIEYDDISNMTQKEKDYLYNIVRKAHINNVDVPLIDKNKEEIENNRFEILLGQIIAGNDNKEMVKEFKSLLIKFKNEDRLPKNQVNEILHDLLLLGY